MPVTKKLRYALDEDQHTANWEAGADVEYEEALPVDFAEALDVEQDVGADPEYEDIAQVPADEVADPDYEDTTAEPESAAAAAEAEAPLLIAARQQDKGFGYELGRAVQPVTQAQPYPVVWRGYLKERHPVTGLLYRVPVYRLADGFWDCYREDELRAA
jgi:hypothetical protein